MKLPKWILVLLALIAAMIAAFLWPDFVNEDDGGGDGTVTEDTILAGRRECPHTWRFYEDSAGTTPKLPLTEELQDIPELHDCQKFLIGSETVPRYSELFAVFASKRLDSLAQDLETADGAVAVAQVFAEGNYDKLGVREGHNCLLLSRTGSRWEAEMVWLSDKSKDCTRRLPLQNRTPLEVQPTAPKGSPQVYPAVARWGFDTENWQHYIIIKCLNTTCQIGKPGFVPTPPQPATYSTKPGGVRHVYEIEGWHDEQFLASRPDPPDAITPAMPLLFGTVIPDPKLGQIDQVTEFEDTWVRVAEVAMSARSTQYVEKANFDVTPELGRLNTIDACLVGSDGCPGLPAHLEPGRPECSDVDNDSNASWRTRHVNAARTDTTFHCTKRYALESEIRIPGTARWRWQAEDETVWFRCAYGCCEVQ